MSEEVVLVKPIKGSRKFLHDAVMYQGVMTQTNEGPKDHGEGQRLGAFNKEKFLGSSQITRVAWSGTKQKYNLGDIEADELNALVEACQLRDEKGNVIKTAQRGRYDDPFFQHKELFIRKKEGEAELDLGNPVNKVVYLNMINRAAYKSTFDNNPVMSAMAKYEITDKSMESKVATRKVDSWMEIGQLFGGLDETKRKKVAIALNLGIQQNSNAEIVKTALFGVLEGEDKIIPGSSESYKQAFIRLCKSKTDDLDLEYKITIAKRKGFLRKKKNQGWLFNGKPTVTTDSQLISYFSEVQNQDDYFELNNLIGDDSSKNSPKRARSKTKSDTE